MTTFVDSYRFAAAGAFDPETDITWHSLFWAEGSAFVAQGYSDTDTVTSWPNETAESDAANRAGTPVYDAVHAGFNGQPVVAWGGGERLQTGAFSSAPSYPITIVCIARVDNAAGADVFFDGTASGARNQVWNGAGSWLHFAGTVVNTGVATDTNSHLIVATFDGSTGNDTLSIDGTSISVASAGSNTIASLSIGNDFSSGGPLDGQIAILGIYEGDITADGEWANFTAWAETHYGLTIA